MLAQPPVLAQPPQSVIPGTVPGAVPVPLVPVPVVPSQIVTPVTPVVQPIRRRQLVRQRQSGTIQPDPDQTVNKEVENNKIKEIIKILKRKSMITKEELEPIWHTFKEAMNPDKYFEYYVNVDDVNVDDVNVDDDDYGDYGDDYDDYDDNYDDDEHIEEEVFDDYESSDDDMVNEWYDNRILIYLSVNVNESTKKMSTDTGKVGKTGKTGKSSKSGKNTGRTTNPDINTGKGKGKDMTKTRLVEHEATKKRIQGQIDSDKYKTIDEDKQKLADANSTGKAPPQGVQERVAKYNALKVSLADIDTDIETETERAKLQKEALANLDKKLNDNKSKPIEGAKNPELVKLEAQFEDIQILRKTLENIDTKLTDGGIQEILKKSENETSDEEKDKIIKYNELLVQKTIIETTEKDIVTKIIGLRK